MKYIIKGFICLVALGVILTLIGTISILDGWTNLKPKKADCILILGCRVYGSDPSPFLISRLDEGLRLYRAGYSKYIIVSGGQGSNEDITEADAMKNYLITKGVDSSKIYTEESSTSTMTNLLYSKNVMNSMKFKDALIITNKYHLKRASLMAKRVGISGSYSGVYNSDYKLDEFSGFLREILAIMKFYILG